MLIAKDGLRFVGQKTPFVKVFLQQARSLRPERADSFFAAFAEEGHAVRWREAKVACLQGNDLLHARSGVEHQRQQHVVPAPGRRGSVDESENGAQFLGVEVFDDSAGGSLERDAQDALRMIEVFGVLVAQISAPAVGCRSVVSSPGAMAA